MRIDRLIPFDERNTRRDVNEANRFETTTIGGTVKAKDKTRNLYAKATTIEFKTRAEAKRSMNMTQYSISIY